MFDFEEYSLSLQGPNKVRATNYAWHPPPIGIIKLNFDRATLVETNTVGSKSLLVIMFALVLDGGSATFISKLHMNTLSFLQQPQQLNLGSRKDGTGLFWRAIASQSSPS